MDFGYLTPLVARAVEEPLLYLGYAVLLSAIIYIARDYVIPIIHFVVENVVYMGVMHTAVHFVTVLAAWFKTNTTMRMTRQEGAGPELVDWTTPLLRFWEQDHYAPRWLLYMEIVFAGAIILLVVRFRSVAVGGKPPVRFDAEGSRIKEKKNGAGLFSRLKRRFSAEGKRPGQSRGPSRSWKK